jgi:hypothetical protein
MPGFNCCIFILKKNTMNQYRLFIAAFIINMISMIVFFAAYFNGLMNVIRAASYNEGMPMDPFYFLK